MQVSPDSVLFVTLDSCRFDTFLNSKVPNIRKVGPLHRAQAPSYFTFGSHAAMFMGFTPGISETRTSMLNPKFGRLFHLQGGGKQGRVQPGFSLTGRSVIKAFEAIGYATIGSGAVGWFDPRTATGQVLSGEFAEFFYPGNSWSVRSQVSWLQEKIAAQNGRPVFAFLNVGETHVPYYFAGAPWSAKDNPCIPFQADDRSAECRHRQTLCLEHVDAAIAPLIDAFLQGAILVCGDHGDCWGEDGLWEHGISHPATLTVPLLVRYKGIPVARAD